MLRRYAAVVSLGSMVTLAGAGLAVAEDRLAPGIAPLLKSGGPQVRYAPAAGPTATTAGGSAEQMPAAPQADAPAAARVPAAVDAPARPASIAAPTPEPTVLPAAPAASPAATPAPVEPDKAEATPATPADLAAPAGPAAPADVAMPAPATSEPATSEPAKSEPAAPVVEAPKVTMKPVPTADLAAALVAQARERLAAAPGKGLDAADKADRAALVKFYEARKDAPLWMTGEAFTGKGRAALAEIARADDWGLSARDFDLPDAAASSAQALADAELKLSLAALKYARHARGGRIPAPREMSSYLDRDPPVLAPEVVLERLAAAEDAAAALVDLHPRHEHFRRLQRKLVEMRASEQKEDKPVEIPAAGPLLAPGKTHPDVALLRLRLKAGDPPAKEDGTPGDTAFYDDALAEAVKAFQRENGMKVDGLVGRNTRAALNGGKRKVDEGLLIANMEAWRWMPEDLGETYVWVNLPEFLVRVVKQGRIIHEERIIAGEIDKQTPVFSHEMETVVLHPFWGVPDSIKVRELLPSLARGSTLQRRGLRLQYNGREVDPLAVDWSRADIRNYHVYQPPGETNVLGEVKFMFPNKHQVYMHDTPTKHLFNSSQRTFSHGCMRVRNPMKLAEIVLREDKGWTRETVQTMLREGPENNNIKLNGKLPVHVTYQTAWVDDDGELQTRPDIYQHEKRIRLALAGKWDQIPRHRDHLLPVEYVRPQLRETYAENPVETFFQNLFGGF